MFTQSIGHARKENMDTEANEKSSSTLAPLGLSLSREKGSYSQRKQRWIISVDTDTSNDPKNNTDKKHAGNVRPDVDVCFE